jgi:hypothetical protein
MNMTSNTHLRLNYSSWPRPRSHWSATSTRNQHTAFRTKTHEHTQRKLARLAACATPVRPVDRAGQTGGYSSRTTNILKSLSDFSRPWNRNTPKTQPTRKKNPSQSQEKQHQTGQELSSNNTTQRHKSQAVHPRQIPQGAHTGQTGQEHRSDR